MRLVLCTTLVVACSVALAGQTASTPPPAPHHEANFDSERKQADELYLAKKYLEALPLYEDLCRQDQTIAVFAERHGMGLIFKAATLPNKADIAAVNEQGLAEIRRAQSLGDNSPLVQTILDRQLKSALGSVLTGIPLTVGYTYAGKPEAQALLRQAESAFSHRDLAAAIGYYKQAAAADPAWYPPAIYAGDAYFTMHDEPNAAIWFQKAIAIDPDRETAYRYWGDALDESGDISGGKQKFELAFVAEPYGKTTLLGLQKWARLAHMQIVRPQIVRPEFTTANGKLNPEPALAAETGDGHASWLVYQQARVSRGATTLNQPLVAGSTDSNGVIHPTGYRHSLAEEDASLGAMLADVQSKLKSGAVAPEKLEPSLKTLLQLQKDGLLDAWILLDAADAGIRADYPTYRGAHRELLVSFVDRYLFAAPNTAQ